MVLLFITNCSQHSAPAGKVVPEGREGQGTRRYTDSFTSSVCPAKIDAECNKLEAGFGDLHGVARTVPMYPGFDVDAHRGITHVFYLGVDAEYVSHLDRTNEAHAVERDGYGSGLCSLAGANARGYVHLRQHPAAEDIAGRILIGRHCQGTRGELTAGFVGHVGDALLQ